MTVDKFGRSPTATSQNVTNVSGVSHEYVNSNFLRKGQAIDSNGKTITNLGSSQDPTDAVRKKYVNEKFFKRGNPIEMDQKAIKNVLPPTEEGDVATKGHVDSKSVGGSDLDMGGHLVKNVIWPEEDHDLVNRAYVYFVAGKRLPIEGGTMQGQIDMNQNSIRNINPNPQNEDEVVPKQWIENNFLKCYSASSTTAKDLNMDGNHVSYLRAPEQNHHAATKGYADTKLSLLGGSMQGEIGMSGNRIAHLGEPEQSNDAVRLSSANEFYLRRDGSNWMQNALSLGGHRVIGMSNLVEDRDGVNKITLDDMIQGLQLYNEEHFVSADAASQLRGPVSFNSQRILNLGHPIDDDDAVNLGTLKIEISQNNMMELPKYLRLDGSSEPTNDLTMSDNRITNLANPINPKDAATKKYVDDQLSAPAADAVTRLAGDLDMSQFKIINLKNPKNPQDAVNRRFVEKNFLQKD